MNINFDALLKWRKKVWFDFYDFELNQNEIYNHESV